MFRRPAFALSWLVLAALAMSGAKSAMAYNVCSDDNAPCTHEVLTHQGLILYYTRSAATPAVQEIRQHQDAILQGVGSPDQADPLYGNATGLTLGAQIEALTTITHFWDPDTNLDSPMIFNLLGPDDYPNAYNAAQALWTRALGEYAAGNKEQAYFFLGMVAHFLGDQTIPTHVHNDTHGPDFIDYDAFEEWMSGLGGIPATSAWYQPFNTFAPIATGFRLASPHAFLTDAEWADAQAQGIPENPMREIDQKLLWLFLNTNQVADYFASDGLGFGNLAVGGDAVHPVDPLVDGWVQDSLDRVAAACNAEPAGCPTTSVRLIDNHSFVVDLVNDNDGDLSLIRKHSYLPGVRAMGALFALWEDAIAQPILLLTVHQIGDLRSGCGAGSCGLDGTLPLAADFYVGMAPGYNRRISQGATVDTVGAYLVDRAGAIRWVDGQRLPANVTRSDAFGFAENENDISPNYHFGQSYVYGLGADAYVPGVDIVDMSIGVWDQDEPFPPRFDLPPYSSDESADLFAQPGRKLNVAVDLAQCLSGGTAVLINGLPEPEPCGPFSSGGPSDVAGSAYIGLSISMLQAPPPSNDGFAYARAIGEGTVGGGLAHATSDGSSSEGASGQPDVWFSYTAPGDGTLRVDTCGSQGLSGLDTTLSVHPNTGATGTAANQLAANDDWQSAGGDLGAACAGSRDSSLKLKVNAGDPLLLRVARYQDSPNSGSRFAIHVSFTLQLPTNDGFTEPVALVPGNFQDSLANATNDGSSSKGQPGQPDLWYSYRPPGYGTLRLDTCGSAGLRGLDTTLSVHEDVGVAGTTANQLAANDDWQDPGGDPAAACPDARDSSLALSVSPGKWLLIRVSRYNASTTGSFILHVAFELQPPPNDGYANAIVLGERTVQGTLVAATNDGASSEGSPGQPDVWYSYVATEARTLRLRTCGSEELSGIDTILSVHSDTGIAGTTDNELDANNNWGDADGDPNAGCSRFSDSAVSLQVAAGEAVLIRVSKLASSASGGFFLDLTTESPLSNDDFAKATPIGPGTLQGTLVNATNDGTSSIASPRQPDVWYLFSTPGPGIVHVHTCGTEALSGLDSELSIHANDGLPGTRANELAYNGDYAYGNDPNACGPSGGGIDSYDSGIALTVTSDAALLIRVSQYPGPAGAFFLTAAFEPAESDTDGDGVVDSADNCTLKHNPTQRDTNGDGYGNFCDADLTNDGIVNFGDLAKMKSVFFKADVDADLNGDGVVNFADLAIMKKSFFKAPGPAAGKP